MGNFCGGSDGFGKNTRLLKDLAKIFAYLVAVIVLGALLASPLYWAAQWLAGHGILRGLAAFKFQKFFDRAAMIAALLLLWPTVRVHLHLVRRLASALRDAAFRDLVRQQAPDGEILSHARRLETAAAPARAGHPETASR